MGTPSTGGRPWAPLPGPSPRESGREKMTRSAKRTLLLTLCVCAILAVGGLLVHAAPPLPATFYGTVKVNGANVPAGTSVDAYIGGISYASKPVQISGADTVYVLDVPGDIPEIAGKEGGVEGDAIQFRVGGLVCAQTSVWHQGTQTNLNLTATGTMPTLTPTPPQPPTNTPTMTPPATVTPQVTSTPQVIDLKPSNTTVRDTFLDSANATANYGSGVRMKVRSISGINYRPLIYFDLSTIPAGSTIRSATLNLYMDTYSHLPDQSPRISIYKVKQDWAEMEATWNNRTSSASWNTAGCESSADRDTSESAYKVVSAISTWYDWNVTSLVQGWVSSPTSNRGMLLVSNTSREVRFYTSNDVDVRFHPYLRIDYIATAGPTATTAPVTPGTTPVVTPAPVEIRGASQDTYINKLDESKNYENKPMVVRGAGEKRALLNFDVSAIPSTAQITSATLRLAATNYDDGKTHLSLNVEAYLANRSWLANQATWLKATDAASWGQAGCSAVPSDRAATAASSTVVQKISGSTMSSMVFYDWNVTSIVQEWVRNPSSYAGLLLMAQDGNYREMSFYDTAYSVADYRPLLRVNWVPGSTPTFTPTPTSNVTSTPTRVLPAGKGAVAGEVFDDLNANGRRDGGEPGLAGVQVHLWQSGVLIFSQATGGNGSYSFDAVNPGWYLVKEVDPSGYLSPPSSPNEIYAQVIEGRVTVINFGDYDPRYVTPGPAVRLPILRKN